MQHCSSQSIFYMAIWFISDNIYDTDEQYSVVGHHEWRKQVGLPVRPLL